MVINTSRLRAVSRYTRQLYAGFILSVLIQTFRAGLDYAPGISTFTRKPEPQTNYSTPQKQLQANYTNIYFSFVRKFFDIFLDLPYFAC